MAEPTLRLPENAPGSYYVDETCIDCDRCRSDAPAFFHRLDSIGLTVVYQQPASPEEIALADEALAGCPTDSIGRESPLPEV